MMSHTSPLCFWVVTLSFVSISMWNSSRPAVVMALATARQHQNRQISSFSFSSLATTTTTTRADSTMINNSNNNNNYRHMILGDRFYSGKKTSSSRYSSPTGNDDDDDDDSRMTTPNTNNVNFKPGDKIQVEVVNFGPLGASVEVIGLGHGDNVPLLPPDAPEPYGLGLIIQREIKYFREMRDFVDVVRGEILPAYVQNVREEDGKLDISLRSYGGKAKSTEIGAQIVERLEEMGGTLNIGEKSTPEEISEEFPGTSKSVFKKVSYSIYIVMMDGY
jgi:predicted RNA-binding protein with RPS1 domain